MAQVESEEGMAVGAMISDLDSGHVCIQRMKPRQDLWSLFCFWFWTVSESLIQSSGGSTWRQRPTTAHMPEKGYLETHALQSCPW